jgi:hypothetical protein
MKGFAETFPLKVELTNDNNRKYHTYLGEDAVDLIKIYLKYRRGFVGHDIRPEEYLIVQDARPVNPEKYVKEGYIQRQIRDTIKNGNFEENGKGKRGRFKYRSHVYRHLFKTECAHAGINPMISEFFMGHDKGIEYVYNHQHELHPEDFVALYKKVEPYLSLSQTKTAEINEQTMAKAIQNNPALASTIAKEVFKDRETVREFFGRLVDEGLVISTATNVKPQNKTQ